jgi:ubiquinone/menaquinone biosynthesis C-methylase UbiE
MSFCLAKRGFDVIGIDSASLAVHKSREEAAGMKLTGSFQARRINAVKMPFKKESFDAVFSYHSLHHMKNMPKAIHKMFRVCKKQGLVVISDLHAGGRREYEDMPDDKFLPRIEKHLMKHAKSIKKEETKINMMFVCKKK